MEVYMSNVIDARGVNCPKPVLMAEEALNKIKEGSIKILVDNEPAVSNLKRFSTKNGFSAEVEKIDNYWSLTILKGYECNISTDDTKADKKNLFVIFATDTFGKDEKLGRILMKAYLETIKVYKELPDAMFFMNTAVRLTTIDDEIIPIIKDIENMGVEIFTCGTCLKHFNLEDQLKIGFRGTTNHIVEGTKEYKKTVWIG